MTETALVYQRLRAVLGGDVARKGGEVRSPDRGRQTIPGNRQIGSEPDHNVRLQIQLLRKHRRGVTGVLEHFYAAIPVRREPDDLPDRRRGMGIRVNVGEPSRIVYTPAEHF